jgi:FHA domain/Domain of unknown function (DUF1707)
MGAPRGWAAARSVRASDAERDLAIEKLRERFADGCLAQDSFVQRVSATLRAREQGELADILADLPSPKPRPSAVLRRQLAGTSRAATRRLAAWLRDPHVPELMLPAGTESSVTIGRDIACDLVLADLTVSRRHAGLLREAGGGWLLMDLGSTNGTRLNGWRVTSPAPLRPGDMVAFGTITFVVAEHA